MGASQPSPGAPPTTLSTNGGMMPADRDFEFVVVGECIERESPLLGPHECLLCYAKLLLEDRKFSDALELEYGIFDAKTSRLFQSTTESIAVQCVLATGEAMRWVVPAMKKLSDGELAGNNMLAEALAKFNQRGLEIATDHFKGHPTVSVYKPAIVTTNK